VKFSIIHHPSAADVAQFADLKLPREPGFFIAEGEKTVERLLQSGIEIISLFLTEEHFEKRTQLVESHDQDAEATVFIASKKSMEKIVGFTLHQGILAAARIPAEPSLQQLIDTVAKPHLFVILDGIADAENVGSLYRTALALGATAVIIDDQTVSPWIRRGVRVSMGAVFRLPTITMNLLEAIRMLRNSQISVIAAALDDASMPLWSDGHLQDSVAIVFGSEGYGISDEVKNECSMRMEIPMQNAVDSLNVGVAQGIFLYEVMRQRRKIEGSG
jgi:tRNA G18 (ribose-2'-O)-methylase SpoU